MEGERGREGEKGRRGDANISFLDVQFLAHSPTTGFGTFNTMVISSMLLVTADSVCTPSLSLFLPPPSPSYFGGSSINTTIVANSHWTGNGIYEGRQVSTSFPSSLSFLFTHLFPSPSFSPFQASPSFWTPRYLSLYADLQAAFGNNYYVACLHWINNGYHEGRRGV